MMVNKINVQKWVDALLSGEFKQGRNVLHNRENNTYCCLGVACEIYQREVGDLIIEEGASQWGRVKHFTKFNNVCEQLPHKVAAWLGTSLIGCHHNGTGLDSLNDNGWTFDQIADVIKQELLSDAEGL